MPSGFPTSLLTVDTSSPILTVEIDSDYRTNVDCEELHFFLNNVLSKISPRRINFVTDRSSKKLSKIFDVTDEVYALAILVNQGENCKELAKPAEARNVRRMKKRFTDPQSGKRQSWSPEGRAIFSALCKEITKLRVDQVRGANFENDFLEHYRRVCPKYLKLQKDLEENERTETAEEAVVEEVYMGDGLAEFLKIDNIVSI